MNLYINTRNTFKIIDLDAIAYLKADGNYTYFFYRDGKIKTELSTLSAFIQQIEELSERTGEKSPFFRMGRSHYINTQHIYSINFQNLMVIFQDDRVKPITGTKGILKTLKDHLLDETTK